VLHTHLRDDRGNDPALHQHYWQRGAILVLHFLRSRHPSMALLRRTVRSAENFAGQYGTFPLGINLRSRQIHFQLASFCSGPWSFPLWPGKRSSRRGIPVHRGGLRRKHQGLDSDLGGGSGGNCSSIYWASGCGLCRPYAATGRCRLMADANEAALVTKIPSREKAQLLRG
jgi:hypothetical protein